MEKLASSTIPTRATGNDTCTTLYLEHDTCTTLYFRALYMYCIVPQSMIHVPHLIAEHETCTALYLRT